MWDCCKRHRSWLAHTIVNLDFDWLSKLLSTNHIRGIFLYCIYLYFFLLLFGILYTCMRAYYVCDVYFVCEQHLHCPHQSHITPCIFGLAWSPQSVQGSSTFFLLHVFLSGRSISKYIQLHFITTSEFIRIEIGLSDTKFVLVFQ